MPRSGFKPRTFPIGRLSSGRHHVSETLQAMRRLLEATMRERGALTLEAEAAIGRAVTHEQARLMIQQVLRLRGEEMEPSELLKCLREQQDAAVARDKAIAELGLNGKTTANGNGTKPIPLWESAKDGGEGDGGHRTDCTIAQRGDSASAQPDGGPIG